ncbi:hypothetical protein CTEN210_13879 [Chaetoceros tenuissimus]|uniref:Uncharacterized protein n=1 Tax=Chaetoceros tenuissimus TaxID=426638 RepID=A0AAD3D433_9STRA|nr:hypothetical protein CTEN210_13879 [Chaetoceros tenuissimus]
MENLLDIVEGLVGEIEIEDTSDSTKDIALIEDVNKRNLLDYTGRNLLHNSVLGEDRKTLDYLLQDASLEINKKTLFGKETALHLALHISNRDTAFKLLFHGADVNARNKYGRTPLHLCTELSLAKLLVSFGADTTLRCRDNLKPIDVVESRQKCNDSIKLADYLRSVEDSMNQKQFRTDLKELREERMKTKATIEQQIYLEKKNESQKKRENIKQQYVSWRKGQDKSN